MSLRLTCHFPCICAATLKWKDPLTCVKNIRHGTVLGILMRSVQCFITTFQFVLHVSCSSLNFWQTARRRQRSAAVRYLRILFDNNSSGKLSSYGIVLQFQMVAIIPLIRWTTDTIQWALFRESRWSYSISFHASIWWVIRLLLFSMIGWNSNNTRARMNAIVLLKLDNNLQRPRTISTRKDRYPLYTIFVGEFHSHRDRSTMITTSWSHSFTVSPCS